MSWRQSSLLQLYFSRLREFYRQPARIFWVYAFPTLLAIGLGLAFRNRPPDRISVLVTDGPHADRITGALDESVAQTGTIARPGVQYERVTPEIATRRLQTGRALLVVEPRSPAEVAFRFDPTRPEAITARAVVDDILQRHAGRADPIATRDETITEPGSRYVDFLIPGLIGANTMGGGLWGIGFLLVNFRLMKLLKRFAATPMPRHHFLAAVMGARLTFLIPDVGILLAMGAFLFGMPIRGNLLLVALLEIVGAMAFAGIGMLIASRAQTTESVSGWINLINLPMMLVSGVFFPYERFPAPLQPFIQALPLTQLVDSLRKVILEGADLAQISTPLLILAAWAGVTFFIALKRFKWT
jgi:ABC-type multidrug transport system permease subunit